MSAVGSGECCCLWSLLRRRRAHRADSRRESLSENSLILPWPRPRATRRAGQRPRCCLVKQRERAAPEEDNSQTQGEPRRESIELKCYSLSRDRVIVSLDKRCCLTTPPNGSTWARPLSCMEDGRRHLDTRPRPDSVSLIKLTLDPTSGKVRRSLSIHEIEADNEFELPEGKEDQMPPVGAKGPQEEENLALAARLSGRSFVLVERNSTTRGSGENAPGEGQPMGPVENSTRSFHMEDSLEHDLVESLSLGRPEAASKFEDEDENLHHLEEPEPPQRRQQVLHEQRLEAFRPKRRKPLRAARRLFRWFLAPPSSGDQRRASDESQEDSAPTIEDTPPSCQDCDHQVTTHEDSNITPRQAAGVVALSRRPESIFLWPKRLSDAYASTQTGGPGSLATTTGRARHRAPAAVMISYNHLEGKEFAVLLHAELAAQGVSAYLDLYDIQKGEDWQDSLNFAILDCRLFVPLVTPSYGETLWTSRECKLADVLAKRIVPINFGQRWPPPSLAIQFATLQYVDWLHHELASVLDPHMDDGCGCGPGWPRECVQAIARQLKARLEIDQRELLERTLGLPAPPPLVEIGVGVSDSLQPLPEAVTLGARRSAAGTLRAGSLDTASTTTSSCHTTSSSSPSCYESMAPSEATHSPPGGSPSLLEELADSSNFVLVPTISARVADRGHPQQQRQQKQQPPAVAAQPKPARRKRSLGQRTKRVLTRLRSSLAVARSSGA